MAHVMKFDLTTCSQTKIGALHGRIYRSVEGLVRFIRLLFLDFIPAIFTGGFALAAATTKQPLLGLIMLGVLPTAMYLTIRQLISQKGVRLELLRNCEQIDGAMVEQLGGLEYVRAANTHRLEIRRLCAWTEKRRVREIRHHFTMSLFGGAKALNEGFFYILVLAGACYCAITGVISIGGVLTFSILFLNVMSPMSEIHRVLDEGHENSLRVGDLLKLLSQPADRSFATITRQQPWIDAQGADPDRRQSASGIHDRRGQTRSRPGWRFACHPAWGNHRRRRALGIRQVHLDQGPAAADPSVRRQGAGGRCAARGSQPGRSRSARGLRGTIPVRLCRYHRGEHRVWAPRRFARGHPAQHGGPICTMRS